jgi:NADPH-dependent glutamate synthase beta subunit-like oxidoreductase
MAKKIQFRGASDMPPMAVSLGDTSFNRTGTWRYLKPIYKQKLAPCRATCPAGMDIPLAVQLIAEEKFPEALEVIRKTNPLPGVLGRVCYHKCEAACNRIHFDEPISVRALERFTAESCSDIPLELPTGAKRPEKVAIVGSGPAGLTCAYFLAKERVSVTVYESADKPGGMLRLGIPSYRLPREVLDREIANIESLGVEFQLGVKVGEDIPRKQLGKEYDAVFIATGAHRSRDLGIKGESDPSVVSGLQFLKEVNTGRVPPVGSRIVVIGGGNTAMDSARVARRLGAEVIVVYRRQREQMPAIPEEVREAEEEGVEFHFLASPVRVAREGDRLRLHFVRMRLGERDSSGRPKPVEMPGSEFEIEADYLLKAIGESVKLPAGLDELADIGNASRGVLIQNGKWIIGGDASAGPSSVIEAVAAGRHAALGIMERFDPDWLPAEAPRPDGDPIGAERINTDYFKMATRKRVQERIPEDRIGDFVEVVGGLSRGQAIGESQRCFSCGVCNQCNTCWLYCPDAAIIRANGNYEFNLEACKGCGICVQECPRGVISVIKEAQ